MESIQNKFALALDDLVAELKQDRSVLAAILCGSLSHDTVWAKSDIDLALIAVDDKYIESSSLALYAGGVNVHALLMTRAKFRMTVESTVRNSFMHSFLAKGRLLYTHDQTIADLCSKLDEIGIRDTQIQLLTSAIQALSFIDKAHKWFVTRKDLDYMALWLLYAATPLARVEVLSARLLTDREVITQAMKLNPAFFGTIYSDLLNSKKTVAKIQAALKLTDEYLAQRAPTLFQPLLEHLRDVGEARSATELDAHFKKHFGIASVTTACEYLSDLQLIGKVSTPVQLTKKSNVVLQELAFVYLGEPFNA